MSLSMCCADFSRILLSETLEVTCKIDGHARCRLRPRLYRDLIVRRRPEYLCVGEWGTERLWSWCSVGGWSTSFGFGLSSEVVVYLFQGVEVYDWKYVK